MKLLWKEVSNSKSLVDGCSFPAVPSELSYFFLVLYIKLKISIEYLLYVCGNSLVKSHSTSVLVREAILCSISTLFISAD